MYLFLDTSWAFTEKATHMAASFTLTLI